MAARPIYIWPDPVLSTPATEIIDYNDDLRTLVNDMFETMYEERGIGLAANQVGVLQRVLVVDLDPDRDANENPEYADQLNEWGFTKPRVFINPEILTSEGKTTWEEGCLSVPGITDSVERADTIEVRAYNENGEPFTLSAHGLYAICIQHEIDHLNGRVFVEYLSKLKRDLIKRKMIKLKKEQSEGSTA